MAIVTDSTGLRSAIQLASSSDSLVELSGSTPDQYSVLTLAKRTGVASNPVAFDGYTVRGSNSILASSAQLLNTRIYQQNVDGPYAPGTVQDLTLNYSSGGAADGAALLSFTSTAVRSITLNNILIKGVHRGWIGNGNLYMSLRSFNAGASLRTTFSMTGTKVQITGQNNGFQSDFGAVSGGSAFLHNWNNSAVFTLTSNEFDEAGFLSSFNLLNFSTVLGSAVISNNTFKRTSNAIVRFEGNRLQNVSATLSGNTFQDGSFLDIYGTASPLVSFGGITFGTPGSPTTTTNTFSTIASGYGIRFTQDAGAITNPVIAANTTMAFSGSGLPLKLLRGTEAGFVTLDATASGSSITIATGTPITTFRKAYVGGQNADTITTTDHASWVCGDDGNDTITGSSSADYLIGGAGNDSILGSGGTDYIDAGAGDDYVDSGVSNDTVVGGFGNDVLIGNSGNDSISGGDGADTITGGLGADSISLGNGTDTLVFGGPSIALGAVTGTITDVQSNTQGMDTISDYVVADDSIQLSQAVFGSVSTGATGALSASKFSSVANSSTTVGVDYTSGGFVYNQSNGQLLYTTANMTSSSINAFTVGVHYLRLATFTGTPSLVLGEFTVVA